jgi:ABC-2 type transport system ATP-binding protein
VIREGGAAPLIALEALTKRFGQVTALDDVTLDLEPGIIGLVGANGAGKSTLIKILLGLLEPTSGRAIVLGHDAQREGTLVRERVGYMPEHDCLPPDVSATDLVTHLGELAGLPRAASRERTAEVLRHVGLYEERYRPIGGYSTGMKQRVKLAQALVHDPRLLLLDEPTNGLDPAGRDDMLGLIRRVGTDFGISVLVTSHLLGELERISDHVIVIDGGRLLRATATSDATTTSRMLAVEVTDRAAELAEGLHRNGLQVRMPGGRPDTGQLVEVELRGDGDYDLVRDAVVALGVGLVRMQHQRHHLTEIFRPTELAEEGAR